MAGMTGTIYAANALLTMSGNASLQNPLVVGTLNLSGNVTVTQLAQGADGADDAAGLADSLLAGNLEFYISDPSGAFIPDERARINDAVVGWDALLAPYNVTITQVSDASLANLIVDTGTSSAAGSTADGVLGCYNGAAGEITILQGWNWYAGANPAQIGQGQYDFQTTVTHEFGHALGLGHSADSNSPMFESLATGQVHRIMTVADLNIPDAPDGADPLMAAPGTSTRVVASATAHLPASPSGITMALTLTSEQSPVYGTSLLVAPGQLPIASNPPTLPAQPIAPMRVADDTESLLGLADVWARFGDQPARAIPGLQQTSPEAIPLIFENPDFFRAEPTDHDPEVSPQQVRSENTAVLDQVFAQMAADMDDFDDLRD